MNTLHAIAKISGTDLSALIDGIRTPARVQKRPAVSGVYLAYLGWYVKRFGVSQALKMTAGICYARAELNRDNPMAKYWEKNAKGLWFHYKQSIGEGLGDQKAEIAALESDLRKMGVDPDALVQEVEKTIDRLRREDARASASV